MFNKLKNISYALFAPVLRILFHNTITSKLIEGTSKRLYYEKAQHIGFLFHRKISYEAMFRDEIMKHIKEGNLVFEIGSNIGQYSLGISEKIGPSGRLVCVEPDTNNFAFLTFNVLKNKCDNIELLHNAVSDQEGKSIFFKDTVTGGRMGSLIKKYVSDKYEGKTEEVGTITLKRLKEQFGTPDFVKVDVEGAENIIFYSPELLDKKTVYFIEVRTDTKKQIVDTFSSAGFVIYLVDEGMKKINKEEDIDGFANLILTAEQTSNHALAL